MSVLFELKDHVGVITIDRQEALNALNRQTLWELKNVINGAEADKDVRVVVITGAGRAFVAGADIAEMSDMSPHEAYEFARVGTHVFNRIERARFPVIAAINGFALGGGASWRLRVIFATAQQRLSSHSRGYIRHYAGLRRHAKAATRNRSAQRYGYDTHRRNG